MNTRQSTIKPIVVEMAIRNAIARRMRDHGIAQFDTLADEVVLDLFGTRLVPTPDGVPTSFIYQGTQLNWPQGVDTRAVTTDEAQMYTRLFALSWKDGLLPGEVMPPIVVSDQNNAAHLRIAYEVLWARVKHNKAQVESPISEPVKEVKIRKAGPRKKVQPVVPDVRTQDIADLEAMAADL